MVVPYIPSLYSVFVLGGVLLGYLVTSAFQVNSPLPPTARMRFTAVVVSAGVFGAYAIPWAAMLLGYEGEGGRSIVTGLLVAWCAAEVLKEHLGVSGSTGDGMAIGLPLAAAVGRIGCLFGHCCVGIPSDSTWALGHNGTGYAPVVPVEIIFHLFFFLLGIGLHAYGCLPGQRLRLYAASYGVFRFLSEWWRPHPRTLGWLSLYQWAAILLVCEVLWTIHREKRRTSWVLPPSDK